MKKVTQKPNKLSTIHEDFMAESSLSDDSPPKFKDFKDFWNEQQRIYN